MFHIYSNTNISAFVILIYKILTTHELLNYFDSSEQPSPEYEQVLPESLNPACNETVTVLCCGDFLSYIHIAEGWSSNYLNLKRTRFQTG